MKLPNRFDPENLDQDKIEELMIKKAIVAAGQFLEEHVEPTVDSASEVESSGATFVIPVVIPEETFSGDGRIFNKDSVDIRDLPLPLMWQINTGAGHDGSVVVGRIDSIERVDDGLGNARGVFDVGAYGREAERLVRNGFLRGISGDFDQFEASTEEPETDSDTETESKSDLPDELPAPSKDIKNDTVRINKARLMGVTLVAKPAFQECFISLDDQVQLDNAVDLEDGEYMDEAAAPVVASGAIPVIPPHDWFKNPELDGPTSLQVMDDGRVYGHLATWNTTHIGMAGQVRPPRSSSDYKYFRSGVVRVDDGTDVTVGQLTLTHGHADVHLGAMAAKNHYDNTKSAVVDVVAGEDQFGIWLAGALRPDVTPEQLRALRASGISGDWRPMDGRLELVAACCVNVAGFPTTRAMVAGGQVQALVAAGTSELLQMKQNEVSNMDVFASRLERIERIVLQDKASELSAQMEPDIAEFNEKLSERARIAQEMMD